MGIFDKLKGGKKDKVFEDELMDTQSELIALTLNMVGKAADEYLESSENSQKRTNGDILDGDLSIQLITFSRKVDVKETLIHFQKIQNSPHIEAVIEATQIIDEYSMYALSTVSDSNILVEFENTVSYKVGDRVLVIGSLELNETS